MPGCDEITIQVIGTPQQGSPLDVGIAQDTRIRCATLQVLTGKLINHPVSKFLADINNEVGKIVLQEQWTARRSWIPMYSIPPPYRTARHWRYSPKFSW